MARRFFPSLRQLGDMGIRPSPGTAINSTGSWSFGKGLGCYVGTALAVSFTLGSSKQPRL